MLVLWVQRAPNDEFSGHELADALQLKGEHGELTLELTGSLWDGLIRDSGVVEKVLPVERL